MAPSKTCPTKGWIQQRERWYDSVDWIRIAMKWSILLGCGRVLLLGKLITDFRGFIDIYDICWPFACSCSGCWWILVQGCIQWVRGDPGVFLRTTWLCVLETVWIEFLGYFMIEVFHSWVRIFIKALKHCRKHLRLIPPEGFLPFNTPSFNTLLPIYLEIIIR